MIGSLLDLENRQVIFSHNGRCLPPYDAVFQHAKSGFFAAASFMSFQQCKFNFGSKPFRHPPRVSFESFNANGSLSSEQRQILPRHIKLQLQVRKSQTCP